MKARLIKLIFVASLIVGVLGSAGAAYATVTVDATSVVSSGALTLTGATASSWTTSAGALTLTAAAASTWSTAAGALTITGTGGLTLDSATTTAVNLGTAAAAKTITVGNAASTEVEINGLLVDINAGATGLTVDAGAGGIDLTTTAVTGDAFDITADSLTTADVFDINAAAITEGDLLDLTVAATRTSGAAIRITDASATGVATGPLVDINVNSTNDVNILDITTAAAITQGNLIDLNFAGAVAHTGDAINIVFSDGASTGDGIDISTGTNLAGNALSVTTAGVRTAPVILITGAATDGGTDDHIFDINQSGVLNSNVLDITYSAGASDGNAIDLNMGTNLAGDGININAASTTGNAIEIDMTEATGSAGAIDIATAGIGAANVGAGLNLVGTGTLANADASLVRVTTNSASSAAASLVDLSSTGALAVAVADGAVLKITETGAAQATTYAVYISSTSNEALHVDTGLVVFDENLTIGTGGITLTDGDAVLSEGKITIDSTGDETSYVKRNHATSTAAVVEIEQTHTGATGSGLLIDQNATGNAIGLEITHDGDLAALDIVASAARTGNVINIPMANQLAETAIDISGAATGTSGEGIIHVDVTGVLAGNAIRVDSTGANATTGQLFYGLSTGQQAGATNGIVGYFEDTGAAQATSYTVYIASTNNEGLYVDTGEVKFDEKLTIAGGGADITGTVAVTGAITATTSITADAYQVTNGSTVTTNGALAKATLQAASYWQVDSSAGAPDAVDIDLGSGGESFDAGDVGRKLVFGLTTGTGVLTVTQNDTLTVTTVQGGATANVDAAGDYIECTILSTTRVACVSFAQ